MANLKQGVEYYHEGDFYYYIEDVPSMPEFAIVKEGGDDGYMTIVRKNSLIPKEESWQWKQGQKHADELRLLTAKAQENFDKLSEELVDKALKSLATRIKMNVAFGEGGSSGYAALMLSTELTKMIKEEAPKVLKKSESF